MEENTTLEALARWLHYMAGVMWIGHLWFFNFVNLNYQKDVPAELKKTVNPPLMLRALFMFRWGAMLTLLSGLFLLQKIHGLDGMKTGGFDTDRGRFMAMGALFGVIMWINVWFVIWPRQKKILGGMQGGPAADPKLAPQAALASKINTYLSVPMLLGMLGGAHGNYVIFGGGWSGLLAGVAVGLGIVYVVYMLAPKVSNQIVKP
ncbi:MAG: urate hydroxylase PuuD [candidate division FCPU426 bacterium]